MVNHYTKNGDNAISLSTLSKEAGSDAFTTTPTSVLRAQTTGGFGGGMQMVPEANFIYKELTAQQILDNITITEEIAINIIETIKARTKPLVNNLGTTKLSGQLISI